MKNNTQKQASNTPQPLAISARELARLLDVSLRQVWRLNSTGKLPKPFRLGGSVKWRREEIIAWLGQNCPDRTEWDVIKETLAGGTKCSM